MTLTFLILNYKTPHHLRINLSHLEAARFPFETETIVVDNASGDESAEMVRTQFPAVQLIESATNVGHPAGNNIGLRAAQGQYVLILNPDIIIRDPSEIERMVAYMDDHPKVGILGPRLLSPDGEVQASCYRSYSRFTPIYRRTFLGKLPWGRRDIERHLMTDFDHNETREVEWLLGAALLLRADMLSEIGRLDERLFLYFGDYELCDRARQYGWGVIYFHDISGITHYHKRESASRKSSLLQLFSYVTRIHLRDWMTYKKTPPYDKPV